MLDWLGPGDNDISHGMVGSLDYDYDYSKDRHSYDDSASDRWDGEHGGYGSHHDHGYGKEDCCPLVVDLLCLAAVLFAIAGATILVQRLIMVELCMVDGAAVTLFVAECRVRRKRSDFDRPWWHGLLLGVFDGKNYAITKDGIV